MIYDGDHHPPVFLIATSRLSSFFKVRYRLRCTAVSASGLHASRLHLEITESAFVSRIDELIRSLSELREKGISIALDDFGTGYSSLSYIAAFPLDKLKIDQSFIKRMTSDPGSRAIVQAVSSLAHSLGLDIVAEGIETELEWQMLSMLGCQYGQGYYFGKPQNTQQLLALACDGFVSDLGAQHRALTVS
ncbi:EAL domain-containing protein [Rhizobium tubonense]|uniref:EAL domain-containing protein n=1 Tax=Rhizobium tubonense TaxID=484088 RepID=A0A2W4CCW3_9HYPH|nr:EAL domain-containing protein [Rhizobium tubonense]PZM10621.1 hypothetical protein CPY51_22945 [Rhizobium tubonense]